MVFECTIGWFGSRGLCDLVDWNLKKQKSFYIYIVEVFATSWIEIFLFNVPFRAPVSRSLRPRGLKYLKVNAFLYGVPSRSLRPRGLKSPRQLRLFGRTPRRGLCDLMDWNNYTTPIAPSEASRGLCDLVAWNPLPDSSSPINSVEVCVTSLIVSLEKDGQCSFHIKNWIPNSGKNNFIRKIVAGK